MNVRYGKTYLKAAKSCTEKGSDYAQNEIERLQRMLDKVDGNFSFPFSLPGNESRTYFIFLSYYLLF